MMNQLRVADDPLRKHSNSSSAAVGLSGRMILSALSLNDFSVFPPSATNRSTKFTACFLTGNLARAMAQGRCGRWASAGQGHAACGLGLGAHRGPQKDEREEKKPESDAGQCIVLQCSSAQVQSAKVLKS